MTLAEMQRVVARRLAALERVADFLCVGQEAAWRRQVLREWRDGSARKRTCGVCGRPFICDQDHFSRYPGCEPPVTPRPPILPVRAGLGMGATSARRRVRVRVAAY